MTKGYLLLYPSVGVSSELHILVVSIHPHLQAHGNRPQKAFLPAATTDICSLWKQECPVMGLNRMKPLSSDRTDENTPMHDEESKSSDSPCVCKAPGKAHLDTQQVLLPRPPAILAPVRLRLDAKDIKSVQQPVCHHLQRVLYKPPAHIEASMY